MWALNLITGLASTALGAYSSYQQGQEQAADERQNAAIARHNALLAEHDVLLAETKRTAAGVKLQEDQLLQLFESEQALGSARVAAGASGARTDVGAPFKWRAQMRGMEEFMRFRAARKGREGIEDLTQEAASFEQEAASFYARAEQFDKRAEAAEKAGKRGGFAAVLTGLGTGIKEGWFG